MLLMAGVVVGTLTGCDMEQGIPPTPMTAISVFEERLGGLDVPVVTGAPVGHGDRNVSLPLGVEAELDADHGTLRFPDWSLNQNSEQGSQARQG